MAVKAPAEGPWLPDERPAPTAAFRQCVGLLLKACGQPVALPGVHNMRAWMVPLIGVGMKLWLHVYEERAEDHSVVGCDACRIIGWQHHPVGTRRYHFMLPSPTDLAAACTFPAVVQARARGTDMPLPLQPAANDELAAAFTAPPSVLDSSDHLLHGVVHVNGFGHLLRINGLEGGSKLLTGRQTMDIWDRLCSYLHVQAVSVEDVSNKAGMELRVLHCAANRQTWYGRWGYQYGRGGFNILQPRWKRAVEAVHKAKLDAVLAEFEEVDPTVCSIIKRYQESLGGAAACCTLGLLLKGMLAALSNPATAAQLLAEGASIAARPAQPSVGRPEGGNGRKAAGPRPLVIQLKPRGTLKSKPDAQEASGTPASKTESKEPGRQARSSRQQQIHSPVVCPEPASGAKDSSKGRGLSRLDSVASGRVASGRSARAVAGSKRRQREEASTDFEQVAGRGHKQPVLGSPKAGSKKKETAPKKETELGGKAVSCEHSACPPAQPMDRFPHNLGDVKPLGPQHYSKRWKRERMTQVHRAVFGALQDFEGWWVPRACARQAACERSKEDLSLVDYALRVAGVSLDGWAVFRHLDPATSQVYYMTLKEDGTSSAVPYPASHGQGRKAESLQQAPATHDVTMLRGSCNLGKLPDCLLNYRPPAQRRATQVIAPAAAVSPLPSARAQPAVLGQQLSPMPATTVLGPAAARLERARSCSAESDELPLDMMAARHRADFAGRWPKGQAAAAAPAVPLGEAGTPGVFRLEPHHELLAAPSLAGLPPSNLYLAQQMQLHMASCAGEALAGQQAQQQPAQGTRQPQAAGPDALSQQPQALQEEVSGQAAAADMLWEPQKQLRGFGLEPDALAEPSGGDLHHQQPVQEAESGQRPSVDAVVHQQLGAKVALAADAVEAAACQHVQASEQDAERAAGSQQCPLAAAGAVRSQGDPLADAVVADFRQRPCPAAHAGQAEQPAGEHQEGEPAASAADVGDYQQQVVAGQSKPAQQLTQDRRDGLLHQADAQDLALQRHQPSFPSTRQAAAEGAMPVTGIEDLSTGCSEESPGQPDAALLRQGPCVQQEEACCCLTPEPCTQSPGETTACTVGGIAKGGEGHRAVPGWLPCAAEPAEEAAQLPAAREAAVAPRGSTMTSSALTEQKHSAPAAVTASQPAAVTECGVAAGVGGAAAHSASAQQQGSLPAAVAGAQPVGGVAALAPSEGVLQIEEAEAAERSRTVQKLMSQLLRAVPEDSQAPHVAFIEAGGPSAEEPPLRALPVEGREASASASAAVEESLHAGQHSAEEQPEQHSDANQTCRELSGSPQQQKVATKLPPGTCVVGPAVLEAEGVSERAVATTPAAEICRQDELAPAPVSYMLKTEPQRKGAPQGEPEGCSRGAVQPELVAASVPAKLAELPVSTAGLKAKLGPQQGPGMLSAACMAVERQRAADAATVSALPSGADGSGAATAEAESLALQEPPAPVGMGAAPELSGQRQLPSLVTNTLRLELQSPSEAVEAEKGCSSGQDTCTPEPDGDTCILQGSTSPALREPSPAVDTHLEGATQGCRRHPAATASQKSAMVQSLHLPGGGTSRLRNRSVRGCDVFGRRLPGASRAAAAAAAAPSSSTGSDASQSPEPGGTSGLAGHKRRQSGSPCAVQEGAAGSPGEASAHEIGAAGERTAPASPEPASAFGQADTAENRRPGRIRLRGLNGISGAGPTRGGPSCGSWGNKRRRTLRGASASPPGPPALAPASQGTLSAPASVLCLDEAATGAQAQADAPHQVPSRVEVAADARTPQAELRLPGGSPRARSSDAQQAGQPASCQACSGSSQPEQHRDPPECRASATAAAVPNTDMVRDTESQPTSEVADAACGARGSAAASPASEIGRPSHLVPSSVPQLSNSHAARQGPSDPAQQGPTDPMQEGPTDPALTRSPAACTRAGSRGLSQVGELKRKRGGSTSQGRRQKHRGGHSPAKPGRQAWQLLRPGAAYRPGSPPGSTARDQVLCDLHCFFDRVLRRYAPAQRLPPLPGWELAPRSRTPSMRQQDGGWAPANEARAGLRHTPGGSAEAATPPARPKLHLPNLLADVQCLRDVKHFMKDCQGLGLVQAAAGATGGMVCLLLQVVLPAPEAAEAAASQQGVPVASRGLAKLPRVRTHARKRASLQPPVEPLVVPAGASEAQVREAAQAALRDLYIMMQRFEVVELSGITFSEDGCLTSDTPQGTVVQAKGHNVLLQPEWRHAGGIENWVVACKCGTLDDDGERMAACDVCGVWMHTRCQGMSDVQPIPNVFVCEKCSQLG